MFCAVYEGMVENDRIFRPLCSFTDHLGVVNFFLNQLDKSEIAARKLIIQEIERHAKKCYPEAVVNQFGSYPCGLSIYSSDLDLSVDNISSTGSVDPTPMKEISKNADDSTKEGESNKQETSRRSKRMVKADTLQPLLAPLKNDRLVRSIQFVRHTRVPLVKATFKCDLVADISCDSASTVGATALQIMSERHGSVLTTLSIFLKVYLHQQKLDEPFTGGLGSYRLYVMLSAHIERNSYFVKDPLNPDLGGLLVSFLQYYSNPKLFPRVIRVKGADPLIFDDPRLITKLHKAFSTAHAALTRPAAIRTVASPDVANLDGTSPADKNVATDATHPTNPVQVLPTPTDNNNNNKSHLAKVINAGDLYQRRRISTKACTAFLTKAASMGIIASNPFSKYLRTMHSNDTATSVLSNPIVASTVGTTRSYSVSSRNCNIYFFNIDHCALPTVPAVLPVNPNLPCMHFRFKYTPYVNSSFANTLGLVYRRLYQLKLLR